MATKKKKKTEDADAPKKGKSKMIVVGVFLAIAAFGAKTFLMKSPSAAAAAAAKVAVQQKLVALCDRQNGIAAPKSAAGTTAAAIDPATERGEVLEMDPLTVNLADGHYLKVGIALQLKLGAVAATAKDNGTGARALDMAIAALSPHTMAQLTQSSLRSSLKQKLGYDTCMAYQGDALTVYFTDFVMQ
jgi:flagellar basal body-associated protein FliL